jgi:ribonuclease-3
VCKALFSPVLEKVKNGGCVTPNHKSNLQEFSLRLYGLKPTYQVESTEGPPHQRFFHVKVYIKNEIIGSGSGHSKKAAEKAAAKDACLHWCKSVEKEIS